jgi:hypothetical protein
MVHKMLKEVNFFIMTKVDANKNALHLQLIERKHVEVKGKV